MHINYDNNNNNAQLCFGLVDRNVNDYYINYRLWHPFTDCRNEWKKRKFIHLYYLDGMFLEVGEGYGPT